MTDTIRSRKGMIQSWDEVPVFASEDEEDAFWSEHSLGDRLLDRMAEAPDEAGLPIPRERGHAQLISVRIDPEMLGRLKALARRRGVGYQTLLKRWVAERLALEEKQDAGGSGTETDQESLAAPRTHPSHRASTAS